MAQLCMLMFVADENGRKLAAAGVIGGSDMTIEVGYSMSLV